MHVALTKETFMEQQSGTIEKIEGAMFDQEGVLLEYSQCEYADMARLQEVLRNKRYQEDIPDVVIFLEHTACITVGRSGGYENILADNVALKNNGIAVHETPRGGNITYHGPGQLVCYPILSLEGEKRDLHLYARNMEEVMIRTVESFGIQAGRKPQYPGVWVGENKIGAMGIAVRKWTTMHGIALNVCPDLDHFSLIVPCGIGSHGVTSMAEVLGSSIDIKSVRSEMQRHFSEIFEISLHPVELKDLIEEESL